MNFAVDVQNLIKHFPIRRRGVVQAVNGVSFQLPKGQTLGLVGESGSGKSTVGRCLLRLTEPTSGRISIMGMDVTTLRKAPLRAWRANAQMVFQDPFDALNPRMRVRSLLREPLRLHGHLDSEGQRARVGDLMDLVRLPRTHLERLPRELSGGEAQRVGIARAIATEPRFLVLDEPTSSLDLSVRAGVLRVLTDLQRELELTYLLISHDLTSVAAVCNTVAVMYLGRIVESGPSRQVFEDPQHPYTQALLSSALPSDPAVRRDRVILKGEIPSPIDQPSGCVFASRCPLVREDCLPEHPHFRHVDSDHAAACVRMSDGTNKLRHSPTKGVMR